MTISRKRLCYTASSETRKIWEAFLAELEKVKQNLIIELNQKLIPIYERTFKNIKFI